MRDGDILSDDQRELVEAHLPLVDHIVSRLASRFPPSCDRNDLVQVGTLGLIDAAVRFDPARGVTFSTFVGRRIEGAILDQLRRDDWAPRSVRASARRIDQAEDELATRLGTLPSANELASAAGMTVQELDRVRDRVSAAAVFSLERPVGGDVPESVKDTVVDRDQDIEADLTQRELRSYLRDALHLLPERHRLVVVGHFFEGRSITELARFLGVSQPRASHLKEEALVMIRQALSEVEHGGEVDRAPTRRQRNYVAAVQGASDWRRRLSRRSAVPA